jgi:hypothetical protein
VSPTPTNPGFAVPAATRARAAALAAQAGISVPDASRDRERARTDPRRAHAQARLMSRTGDGDGIVSAADRYAQVHRKVTARGLRQLEQPQDGLAGALPQYVAGSL